MNQKIIQHSHVIKKKFNFKNQEILLVEAFLVHNSRTKIFPDKPFSQIVQNNTLFFYKEIL